jgi:hypothetical protein
MAWSGGSALVEHHPWLLRLNPSFPGRVLPSCNPWDSRLPRRAGPQPKIHAGSQGVEIARRAHFPGYLVGCKLSVIDTATDSCSEVETLVYRD